MPDLTGSAPDLVTDTTAGLSHEWRLETKYYTTTLPIWVDEIPDAATWRAEFTKPEAKEVVTAIGAWIFCFRKPVTEKDVDAIKDVMAAIAKVVETACGYGDDHVRLAVAMPQSTTPYLDKSSEDWDDLCMEYGFEFVDTEVKGKNQYGEEMGVKRVVAALEAQEWDGVGADDEFGLDDADFEEGLDAEEREMGREMFGLKNAICGLNMDDDEDADKDEEAQVEELEGLMRKMAAIKGIYTIRTPFLPNTDFFPDQSEGMSEAERKRFAAKAVNDLMKDL